MVMPPPLSPVATNLPRGFLLVAAGLVGAYYVALLVMALPTVLGDSAMFLSYTLDDSYMYLRYAGNLREGLGIAWNPDGVQTYGVTSLLFLLLVTPLTAVPLSGGAVLMLTSWILGALFLGTVIATCRLIAKSASLQSTPLLVLAVAGPLLFQQPMRTHSLSGMDTTLAAFTNALLILSLLRYLASTTRGRLALVVATAYLSISARPDSLICAVGVPVLMMWWVAGNRRAAIGFLLGITGVLAIDLSVKAVLLGDPLPLAAYVKHSGYYEHYAGMRHWNPVAYLGEFARLVLPSLWVLILFGQVRHLRMAGALLLPSLATFAYLFTVSQIMGLHARFYFPSLPFWMVAAFVVLDSQLQGRSTAIGRRQLATRAAGALFLTLGLWAGASRLVGAYETYVIAGPVEPVPAFDRGLPQLGAWRSKWEVSAIAKGLPVGVSIGATEVGFLGASAPGAMLIDLAGLNDRTLAHEGFSVAYLLDRQLDLIWFPHWNYVDMNAAILKSDAFWAAYDYYCDAYDYGIAIRKTGRFQSEVRNAVARNWLASYAGRPMRTCPRP